MFRLFDSSYQQMNPILEEGDNILWLGDFTAALDRTLLDSKGIKTVLTVATGLDVAYGEPGINHKVYHILDSETANIGRLFQDTITQIIEGLKRGSVLVHCAAGVSRSASVVIAYLMKTKGLGFQEAFNFVRKKRSVIQPNYGFIKQLRNYQKEIRIGKKEPLQLKISENPQVANGWQMTKTQDKKVSDLNIVGQQAVKQRQSGLLTQPKITSSNSTRANSTLNSKKQFELQKTYQGPQIITYAKNNKLVVKNNFAIPEIKQKSYK
ncbi:unnamed protein product [Paramecium octaurelia]|uniref:protein-tyrosine-phosphatase n=1 Tax=Paramecium octaurelia TaxID=43137 RepID=A0A8S1UPU6_PAROT|nr:unnamed protein product [Paramecium octaurelia]CAD8166103.1 unnamed protein product [Paramecium octaurelia]